jgi:hypothetical protein
MKSSVTEKSKKMESWMERGERELVSLALIVKKSVNNLKLG